MKNLALLKGMGMKNLALLGFDHGTNPPTVEIFFVERPKKRLNIRVLNIGPRPQISAPGSYEIWFKTLAECYKPDQPFKKYMEKPKPFGMSQACKNEGDKPEETE